MRNRLEGLTRRIFIAICLSLACAAVTGGAMASDGDRCTRCPGGGEMPGPFGTTNAAVELAPGELYTLDGQVVVSANEAFLMVDLEAHPWLASKQRQKSPYYPIKGAVASWRRYNGVRVRLIGEAEARIVTLQGQPQQLISLKPLLVTRL
jgi:hypothetical protein